MNTYILYILVSLCAPASTSPAPMSWQPSGEFSSRDSCVQASRALGADSKPKMFKCVKK